MKYVNFDLLIEEGRKGYRARVLNSPAGQAYFDFDKPNNEWLAHIALSPKTLLQAKEVGHQLFQLLFQQQVRLLLQRSLDLAQEAGTGLRIRLRLGDVPQLANLAWEYLYDATVNRFLALSLHSPIVRYLDIPMRVQPIQATLPIKILVMLSTPLTYPPLDVEHEWQRLQQAVGSLQDENIIQLERLESATLSALQRRLRSGKYQIFHFIGHGLFDSHSQQGALLFEGGGSGTGWDAKRSAAIVFGEQLARFLRDHEPLRLVVLNACEGAKGTNTQQNAFAGVAQTLVQQTIPAVVAMQDQIMDTTATIFAYEFYSALANRLPIDSALSEARKAMSHLPGAIEWGTPVLYMRASDGHLLASQSLTLPSFIEQRPFVVPYRRNKAFVGRQKQLQALHKLLKHTFPLSGRQPIGLVGLGGTGKSQLAIEYLFRYADAYPGGVFWINAAEPLEVGLAELGKRQYPAMTTHSQEQQIRAAISYLHNHPNTLLVLDHLDEPSMLNLPISSELVPADLPCSLLFTTRRYDTRHFKSIELTGLEPDEALQLLLREKHRQPILDPTHSDHHRARKICAMLGYLPLALEVAAAHLARRPNSSVSAYCDLLIKRGVLPVLHDQRVRPRAEDLPTRHDAAVIAALESQWETLHSQPARLLLQVGGQLAEEAFIPRARLGLLAGLSDQDDGFFASPLELALTELQEASLIECLPNGQIHLNALVREFAKQLIPPNNTLKFRHFCASNLVQTYSDIAILEEHVVIRGIDALQEDLATALELLSPHSGLLRRTQQFLLSYLRHEAHNLRNWDRELTPNFFAQQLLNRHTELKVLNLAPLAKARLAQIGDPYLALRWRFGPQSPRLERTLLGHMDSTTHVVVTPDGHHAISTSADTTLRVWNLLTGQEEHILAGHQASVNIVVALPDEWHAISGAMDGTLKLWNWKTGQEEYTLQAHSQAIHSLLVMPDGERFLSAGADGTIKQWHLLMQVKAFTVSTQEEDQNVGQSGEYFEVKRQAWRIPLPKVVDAAQLEQTITAHQKAIHDIIFTPDGNYLISASADGLIKKWDLTTWQAIQTFRGHTAEVLSLTFSSDGQRLISSSADRSIIEWDLQHGTQIRIIRGHRADVEAVTMMPNGKRLISVSADNLIKTWRDDGRVSCILSGHSAPVTHMTVIPSSSYGLSTSQDHTIKMWNLLIPESVEHLKGHFGTVNGLDISPTGKQAFSVGEDGILRVWDMQSGHDLHLINTNARRALTIAVAPNGKYVLTGCDSGVIHLWVSHQTADGPTWHRIHYIRGHAGWTSGFAISPNNRRVVSVGSDGLLKVWDVSTQKAIHTLAGHEDAIADVVMSHKGRIAISASYDQTLKVWDLQRGKLLHTLRGHQTHVQAVAITNDNKRLLSADAEGHLYIWDLITKQPLHILTGHTGWVRAVSITPDGKYGISAGKDHTLRIWDMQKGRQLAMTVLSGMLHSLALCPNGRTILVGDAIGNVYCLDFFPLEEKIKNLIIHHDFQKNLH